MSVEEESFRDRISTVDEDGKRVWIFPKKPKGKFFNKRKIVSYILLLLLFGLPFIKYEGEPFIMLNIIERKFIIFGNIFWPQDFYLVAISIIIAVVFIFLFTVVYGRLFCGWICPQTIFMEMVFRRIEYWIDGDFTHQKRLKSAPWNAEKIFKRSLKHLIFWIFSFAIANTFLAYIISADELYQIIKDPVTNHLGGFIAMMIFTSVFYFVFAHMREQICTTICPYGRMQGVLLNEDTVVIAYDYVRGEERGKFRKNEDRNEVGKGDCIDCLQCVYVCPTGIDIRNGTQLECVNCTACIDACDHMMESVGLEKGLIRYVSENGIKERKGFKLTKKVKAYSLICLGLIAALVILMITRSDFQARITRQRGTTFLVTEDGSVSNIFEIYLLNKTRKKYDVKLKLEGNHGTIETAVKKLYLAPEKELKERFIVKIPFDQVKEKEIIYIDVYGNGKKIHRVKTKFIGPVL